MTEELNQPAKLETLVTLTYEEIQERLGELRVNINQANVALARLDARRTGLLDRAGATEFPKLTVKVWEQVKLRNPGFFTAERDALARQHSKLWGIFNRRGTLAALELLRADYCTYLEEAGYVAAEDREILHLHDQQAVFRDEVFRLEELEVLHPVHRMGVVAGSVGAAGIPAPAVKPAEDAVGTGEAEPLIHAVAA
jgi:hypothetical protein